MQWLISLETENDPIPACRLLNIFRRKGVKIGTFNLTAKAPGFSLMAVVDTPEGDVDHLFNFLRGIEGIRHVTYYRHQPSADASFVFIDSSADSSIVSRFTQSFPESKIIFASNGKYLFEVSPEKDARKFVAGFDQPGFLPFALIKTTQTEIRAELVGASAQ
jgi:acetolactate synthase regulatory subunit